MARGFGVAFTIGAKIATSVNSAFTTVEQKIKNARSQMASASRKAKTMQKALDLQGQRDELVNKLRASGGTDEQLKKELAAIAKKYRQAKAEAEAYGGSVRDWRGQHEEAIRTLEHQNRLLGFNQRAQEQSSVRGGLRSQAMSTVVPALAIAAPVGMAVKFESAMADASKTIEGMRAPTGELTSKYYAMETAIKKLGRTLPLTHEELAALFAAGGQQGITDTKELEEFATMAAQMSVSFGMSQESAADAIGGYRASLGLSMEETRSMLDLMNQYANTSSATEADIAEVVRRIGGLGKIAGVSAKPMTALAATLTSMKVAPEVAATSIKNLMLAMTSGTSATEAQDIAFEKLGFSSVQLAKDMQENGPKAIISVLDAVKKLPKDEQLAIMQKIFGKESLGAIAPMLGELDLVIKNLRIAGDETAYAGAMQKEFENRNSTSAAKLIILKNRVSEVGINIGETLLPALVQTVETIAPVISAFADYVAQNPNVIKTILLASAGFIALKLAATSVLYTTSLLKTASFVGGKALYFLGRALKSTAWGTRLLAVAQNFCRISTIKTMAVQAAAAVKTKALAVAQKVAAGAVWLFNAAMSVTPLGLAIKGITALVAGMVYLYNTCEPVRAVFDAVFGFISNKVALVWDSMKALWEGMKSVSSYFGFGDDEDEADPDKPSEKKNREALERASGVDLGAGTLPKAMAKTMEMPDMEQMQSQGQGIQNLQNPSGANANVSMNFAINGITDEAFASRIIKGISARKSDFERVISEIVSDQMRVSYEG